jgi:hypothetical protein
MVLGYGPDDAQTYGALNWQDAAGNLYACASLPVSDTFTTTAQTALERPTWDTNNIISMAAANRAQAALVFWQQGDTDAPQASPDKLTVIRGPEGLVALAMMGLSAANITIGD